MTFTCELPEELEKMLQPGNKVKLYYGPKSHLNKLMHIRAIVDGEWVVYKYWLRHKKRWEYFVEWAHMFELWFDNEILELVK